MMNKIPFKTLTLFLLILIGNLSLAEEKKNSVFASLKGKLIELKDGKAEDAKISSDVDYYVLYHSASW